MAIRDILTVPDPALKQKSAPVTEVDDALRALMTDMLETMYAAPGIGLAAPQIGELKRIIVLDIDREEVKTGPLLMANPEVIEASDEDVSYEEGCLSVPGLRGVVPRFVKLRYRGVDMDGNRIERTADGFHARVVQHEVDHLNGLLFIDRMSTAAKVALRSRLKRMQRETVGALKG